jgi:hypothetical protein
MSQVVSLNAYRLKPKHRRKHVAFSRHELFELLNVYSRRVASGEWRDYAIDHGPGMAAFSIFRHTAEEPLFAVVKLPTGARSGPYLVVDGQRKLAEGEQLRDVLALFEDNISLLLKR